MVFAFSCSVFSGLCNLLVEREVNARSGGASFARKMLGAGCITCYERVSSGEDCVALVFSGRGKQGRVMAVLKISDLDRKGKAVAWEVEWWCGNWGWEEQSLNL